MLCCTTRENRFENDLLTERFESVPDEEVVSPSTRNRKDAFQKANQAAKEVELATEAKRREEAESMKARKEAARAWVCFSIFYFHYCTLWCRTKDSRGFMIVILYVYGIMILTFKIIYLYTHVCHEYVPQTNGRCKGQSSGKTNGRQEEGKRRIGCSVSTYYILHTVRTLNLYGFVWCKCRDFDFVLFLYVILYNISRAALLEEEKAGAE